VQCCPTIGADCRIDSAYPSLGCIPKCFCAVKNCHHDLSNEVFLPHDCVNFPGVSSHGPGVGIVGAAKLTCLPPRIPAPELTQCSPASGTAFCSFFRRYRVLLWRSLPCR